jgi:hypothetical protein
MPPSTTTSGGRVATSHPSIDESSPSQPQVHSIRIIPSRI